MIPERVALKGFLSYDEEQVLTFDGAPLWLLAGPNGSGKSSVFDAITFCLFGGHRGGKDDYEELINKKNDRGAVEFHFLLDGKRYRVRRTLKRKKGGGAGCTQDVFQWSAAGDGDDAGEWKAVPDTGKKSDFDKWVQENIGLNFDTFTASVLLVQGKADNLLTSDPKDRHKMLARIMGMERYEKLHGRAVVERNALDAQAKALQIRLDGLEEVTAEELAAAGQAIEAADAELTKARSEVERVQGLEVEARRWAELQGQVTKLTRQIDQAEKLLAKRGEIERAWARLQELDKALPPVKRAVEQRERLSAAAEAVRTREVRRQELAAKIEALDQALDQAVQKRQQREQAVAAAEQRRQELADELQALALALPQVRALALHRDKLRQARAEVVQVDALERQAVDLVRQRQAELAPLVEQFTEASSTRQEADHHVTRAATRLKDVRDHFERFTNVVGEKVCRYCGQEITAEHARYEQDKLKNELAAAEAEHRAAGKEQAARLDAEKLAHARHESASRQLTEAQGKVAECQRKKERVAEAAVRCAEACALAYAELAESFRGRVNAAEPADWAATVFPTPDDLQALGQKQAGCQAESAKLDKEAKANRQQAAQDEKEEKRLEEERLGVRQTLEQVKSDKAVQEGLLASYRENLAAAITEVPEPWKARAESADATQLQEWHNERDALQAQGAEVAFQELHHAGLALQRLVQNQRDLESQRDAIPAEARRDPAEVRRLLTEARQTEKGCQDALVNSQTGRQRLLDRRDERRRLGEERGEVLRLHNHYQLLAKYLDRDYLQRYLMRKAERTIVAYARDILDRLTNGQLSLQQRAEEGAGDKALVLEACHRSSADQSPHRVEMLSGSERFRVAVSLALAIGQYASRQHRPIQSVIIDEGFGCLDPANRHLMIQELHNLQGQLHRILLVSHQDEFADAFTNGYHFELAGGATRVRRFSG